MGGRCNLNRGAIAFSLGVCALVCAAYYGGFRSTGEVPRVVEVHSDRYDDQHLGVPTLVSSSSGSSSDSLGEVPYEVTVEEFVLDIYKILDFEEGFRAEPYLCSMGYVTIGYGTKLHTMQGLNPRDFPITVSKSQGYEWLESEVSEVVGKLSEGREAETFNSLDRARQTMVVSMAYQMGYGGVLKFKKMWLALAKGDYNEAADQALDSRWSRQTPARAKRHAGVIRTGDYGSYNFLEG